MLYPVSENAVIAGRPYKKRYETVFYDKAYHIKKNPTIPVFGTIGFGLQALDYLDGNWSKCGIYNLTLKIDDQLVYSFSMDKFSFDETRYINSHVDYEQKIRYHRNIYKTWKDPGNKLNIYSHDGDGLYSFTDGKTHIVRYEITDVYGNLSTFKFRVVSKKQDVEIEPKEGIVFKYNENNHFENDKIELEFPEGSFYRDIFFQYSTETPFEGLYSLVHNIHNKYVPVHENFSIKIKPENLEENLQEKALLAYVNTAKKVSSAIGGEYKDGWVEAKMRGFGPVAVTIDTIPPTISSLSIKNKNTLVEKNRIRFKIKDNFSGIRDFRGTIDDKWVLFEYDAKNSLISYTFDQERFEFGKRHIIKLEVIDEKKNRVYYEASFYK